MGTNYYAVRKIPASIKFKICELIDNDKYDEAKELFNNNYIKVHIGKSSYGWKFLFNYNNFKYYDLTKESISSFLNDCDITIYNEYGDKIDVDEFWKMVKSKEDGLDNNEYYKDNKNLSFYMLENNDPIDLVGKYDIGFCEFYSDGLRFSTSTEFS